MTSDNSVYLLNGALLGCPGDRFLDIIEALRLTEGLRRAHSIFIKVNLCAGSHMEPQTGVNVSSELASSVVRLLRAVNSTATILIGESDSVGYSFAHDKFRFLGYDDLASQPNVTVVDLTRTEHVLMKSAVGRLRVFALPSLVTASDFLVTLGKIKTHNIVGVSGAMKNLFGVLPDQDKHLYHPSLDQVIVDVNRAAPVQLCILDGNPGMEGNGPVRGNPVAMNLTLIGNNPVATDAVMAHTMGLDPYRIRYLRLAQRDGLGDVDMARIRLLGARLCDVRRSFQTVSAKKRLIMRLSLTVQGWGGHVQQAGHLMHRLDALSDVRKLAHWIRSGRLRRARDRR